nr:hypothetical protein [Bryobacterales bacterium]
GYRFQPYGAISLNYQYNDIRLPEGYGQTQLWLAGTRLDVSFSRSLFLTTFIQYNEQQNNMNLNTRMQWRYRPASDIFVVWTDNYLPQFLQPGQDLPGLFAVKNRALVFKWNYWWNL